MAMLGNVRKDLMVYMEGMEWGKETRTRAQLRGNTDWKAKD